MRPDALRSALIAGVIAAVIWIVITAATSGSATMIWVGGIIFLVGTAVVTYIITMLVSRAKQS